jgi:ribosomal protein S27E
MKKISLEEFEKKYMNKAKEKWDFRLFKIKCNKCGSESVEYNGNHETQNGYYGEITFHSFLVVKCHDCGNAMQLHSSEDGDNDYCPNCDR